MADTFPTSVPVVDDRPLHLLQMRPDMRRLAVWAQRNGIDGRRDGDLGYALHALLTACFGEGAPHPFRLLEPPRGRFADPLVLGYADRDAATLRAEAQIFADAEAWAAMGLDRDDGLQSKRMPDRWQVGTRLQVDARVRPILRTRSAPAGVAPKQTERGTFERDIYLMALEAAPDAEKSAIDRAAVYSKWFAAQLRDGGLEPLEADGPTGGSDIAMTGFQRTRVGRRDASRRLRRVEGPDALMRAVVRVQDPAAFTALLRRGIGRHRAFGFGMVLLSRP